MQGSSVSRLKLTCVSRTDVTAGVLFRNTGGLMSRVATCAQPLGTVQPGCRD